MPRNLAEKVAKEIYEAAQAFAKDLETKEIILTLKTGEGGRTFGSVSSKDEVWNKNFRLVNATIRKYLFSTDDIYNPSLYIPDLSEIEPSSDFVSYYEQIKEKMEEAKGIKIKTIFDARRYI